jgi:hypothetical protein
MAGPLNDRERIRVELRTLQLRGDKDYRDRLASAAKRFPMDVEILLLVGRAQDPSHDANDWILAADTTDAMRQHDSAYAGTFYAQSVLADHRGERDAAWHTVRPCGDGKAPTPALLRWRRPAAASLGESSAVVMSA